MVLLTERTATTNTALFVQTGATEGKLVILTLGNQSGVPLNSYVVHLVVK